MNARRMMTALRWLTARPIAHRGLHDAGRGVIENTPSAVAAAIQAGYGVEVDLQTSADGEAMVHHDATLDRLTAGTGPLRERNAKALRRIAYKETADRMMSLGELLDLVAGGVPLLLELKSRFDGDARLAERAAAVLAGYEGPVAAMSFDSLLVAAIERRAPRLARGVVAERRRALGPARAASPDRAAHERSVHALLQVVRARPHFVAYRLQDIATVPPLIARHLLRLPMLAWTVRSEGERIAAMRRADQVIFEGFRPPANHCARLI